MTDDHVQAIDSMNGLFLCGPQSFFFFPTEDWNTMAAISHSIKHFYKILLTKGFPVTAKWEKFSLCISERTNAHITRHNR